MAREIHHGHVVDNADPKKLGRIMAECSTIVSGESLGDWILPRFHFVDSEHSAGCFWVPNIGSSVDVEIETGLEAQVNDFDARWICDVYPEGTVPDEFQENYPNRRGWKTSAGHLIFFDDTENSQEIHIIHASGSKIYIEDNGTINVVPVSGQTIELGSTNTEQIIKGESRNNDLDLFLNQMITFVVAVSAVPGMAGPCGAFQTAIEVYQAQLAGHLSNVTNTE